MLEYASGNDIDKAIFVIGKLAVKKNKELSSIISQKLKTVSIDKNVDYLVCLLTAAKDLNLIIPNEFLDKVSADSFFQIQYILKTDFDFII